jgi:hypothetical protein
MKRKVGGGAEFLKMNLGGVHPEELLKVVVVWISGHSLMSAD